MGLKTWRYLAERLDRVDIAEPLYRQYSGLPNTPDGTVDARHYFSAAMAASKTHSTFMSRSGRKNDDPEHGSRRMCSSVSAPPIHRPIQRRSTASPDGWKKRSIEKEDSGLLLVTLANFREQQKRYDEAKVLYQNVIKHFPADSTTQRQTYPRHVIQQSGVAHGSQGW